MKIYTVYTKKYEGTLIAATPDEARDVGAEEGESVYKYNELSPEAIRESAVFVPEAFSWKAIIFPLNFVWAAINGCWLFLGILVIFFFSGMLNPLLTDFWSGLLVAAKIGIYPFLGVWANDFWRRSLENRGYELETVIGGKDEAEAQLRYFEQNS